MGNSSSDHGSVGVFTREVEGGRKHTLETESRCAGNEGPLVFRSSKESEACVIESKCFEWRIQHVADA